MKNTRRLLWQAPWQYRESALLVGGIVAAGFALQLTLGPFNFFLLHHPANIGAALVLALFPALSFCFRRHALIRYLSGIPFCVSLLGALVCFSLVMGLTPQTTRVAPHSHALVADLGLTMVTASWPFVLLYTLILVALGLVIMQRLAAFRKGDLTFYANHVGLWILLLAAGLGAADRQRFVMHVQEGEVEWRVYGEDGAMLELPIAIRLKDFSMEEYPPKLVRINRENGKALPEGSPQYIQIDAAHPEGKLGDWSVRIDEYLHEAVRSAATYKASPMPAATPAARVTATHSLTGETKTGWICGGGAIPGFFSGLTLEDGQILVMTQPEPKRFVSDITVLTREGQKKDAQLAVNEPLGIGPWVLYQHSYDTQAGKMSTYSGIELVRDAWLWPAYAGIMLMGVGSVRLIWTGTGKRRHDNDLG